MLKMTPDQSKWLQWLVERGSSGVLDRFGRVMAGGDRAPQGSQTAWLGLVAKGYVAGQEDRIQVTPLGQGAALLTRLPTET
jgi:hypothetical protein